ncbi:LysE family translocator [Polymorphum gilvum]|uniref:RhtB family transporter n=1 Tax=Polymorphum gilvum (strain LMG 25793 / CGMCC 1.9160 / SL003B-26A1) TaxID=991905 RepID=F2IVA9_POLGS|nr:LysE family translocator [Polymorphum gilvum]ADZ72627.1 RhtB family transporter [Polymorphum gilvum SL003B-26A1]
MPPFETLAAFAVATLVFAYMPGPALLYTAAQTVARGRAAGFQAALGIHVGCYGHVLAAAFGLSAVFTLVPTAYAALKLIGGAYLVYLGYRMIRTQVSGAAMPKIAARSRRRAFAESMLVELLNPKVAIFFIAFLPQFVDPAASLPVWAQFLILGALVNLTFTSADLLTVVFASRLQGAFARSARWQDVSRWLGGSVLMGLGARLALDRN